MSFLEDDFADRYRSTISQYWKPMVESIKDYLTLNPDQYSDINARIQLIVLFCMIYIIEKLFVVDNDQSREAYVHPLLGSIGSDTEDEITAEFTETVHSDYNAIRDHFEEESDGKELEPHEYGTLLANALSLVALDKPADAGFTKICTDHVTGFVDAARKHQSDINRYMEKSGIYVHGIPGVAIEPQVAGTVVMDCANQAIDVFKAISAAHPKIIITATESEDLRRELMYYLLPMMTNHFCGQDRTSEREAFLHDVAAFIAERQYKGKKKMQQRIRRECIDYDPVLSQVLESRCTTDSNGCKTLHWDTVFGTIGSIRRRLGDELFRPVMKALSHAFFCARFGHVLSTD